MSRLLPRYTDPAVTHDPLEVHLARLRADEAKARSLIADGRTPDADPADLRGIPVIGRGVGGTSPGTNPTSCISRMSRHA